MEPAALVYILITAVILTLITSYAFAFVMTDSGRLELKKLAVRRQYDLELAKVGAVELMKTEDARNLMLEAMRRSPGTESRNYEATVNALLSDHP